MFVIGNVFIRVGQLGAILTGMYMLVIVAAALITWFPVDPHHPAVRFLRQVTEPVYDRLRKYLPRVVWENQLNMDFTPVVVLLGLWFLSGIVFDNLVDLGVRLK